jgi:hypothetical protein
MRCPQCGHENAVEMKFCGECGTRLAFADLKGSMELLKTGEPSITCEGCGCRAAPALEFCPKCGRKLSIVCRSCGFLCPPAFAVCPKCGSSLKAARRSGDLPAGLALHPADADRRIVTATTLGERLDPEEVRAFQNDLFGSITAWPTHAHRDAAIAKALCAGSGLGIGA